MDSPFSGPIGSRPTRLASSQTKQVPRLVVYGCE
jgi:hypothetical protein